MIHTGLFPKGVVPVGIMATYIFRLCSKGKDKKGD